MFSVAPPQAETFVSVFREPAVAFDPGITKPASPVLSEPVPAAPAAPTSDVGVGPVLPEEKRVAAADPPPSPEKPWAAAVKAIRERFGLGARHAALLEIAAEGCLVEGSSEVSARKVRGVYPLPFICGRRSTREKAMRAGARRRAKIADRRVSKTNLVVALLNLLFGGMKCLEAAVDTRMGAAQHAAVSRVQQAVTSQNSRSWVILWARTYTRRCRPTST